MIVSGREHSGQIIDLNFDNRIQGYGLFLKLTGIAGSTGSVDVMIKR